MYTHIHTYACLCMIFTYPLSTDRVSLFHILNKMAAIQRVLQFVCIHTNIHTRIYIYTYIYVYQYDAINEFILIHVLLCSNYTSHYHRVVLFMNRMAANAISGFHVL